MVARIPLKQSAAPALTDAQIRDISVLIYKKRLGPDSTRRMLEKDNDDGKKLRERAGSYDPLTRAYVSILGEPK